MKLFASDDEAPMILHAKVDRLWLIREAEGEVSVSTLIRDPDDGGAVYAFTGTLTRHA